MQLDSIIANVELAEENCYKKNIRINFYKREIFLNKRKSPFLKHIFNKIYNAIDKIYKINRNCLSIKFFKNLNKIITNEL